MLKNYTKALIPVLLFSLFLPFFSVEAASPSYKYRLTEMGSGTRQTGSWSYEISDEKYSFSTDESVFALTRIFDITNVSNFQFKYEIRGATTRDAYSPIYRPNRSWWAEIWYWDEFGPLPAGNYTLAAFVSLDGGSFRHLETKKFNVGGENNYDSRYEYDSLYSPCANPDYKFEWSKVGRNVRSAGTHVYEIEGETASFRNNEDIYVLAKNSQISGVDTFRLKFEAYKGGRLIKSNEVPTLNPNCSLWSYNYSWNNLGRLASGQYEIRTYMKVNNGSYRLMSTKAINVGANATKKSDSTAAQIKPIYRTVNPYQFDYAWTAADDKVNFEGNYKYSLKDPRTVFASNEDVRVLTKLSNMKNIRSFRIRHELHKDGVMVQKTESSDRVPNSRYWEYNYTESNFGKLASGNYEVRVFISVEKKPWDYLDTKLIRVEGSKSIHDNFDYEWTEVGGEDDFRDSAYGALAYPSYVKFPFSVRQYSN